MTNSDKVAISILMADDDPDDRLLTRRAMEKANLVNPIVFVEDGVEMLEYLRNTGKYEGERTRRPGIILLDLNMPRMDGREALRQLKEDPDLRSIPVVVLTTSRAEEDLMRSYDNGAASYISKPVTFDALTELMRTLGQYWIEFVELPDRGAP